MVSVLSGFSFFTRIDKAPETPIQRIEVTTWRVPGAGKPGPQSEVCVDGTLGFGVDGGHCVGATDQD